MTMLSVSRGNERNNVGDRLGDNWPRWVSFHGRCRPYRQRRQHCSSFSSWWISAGVSDSCTTSRARECLPAITPVTWHIHLDRCFAAAGPRMQMIIPAFRSLTKAYSSDWGCDAGSEVFEAPSYLLTFLFRIPWWASADTANPQADTARLFGIILARRPSQKSSNNQKEKQK